MDLGTKRSNKLLIPSTQSMTGDFKKAQGESLLKSPLHLTEMIHSSTRKFASLVEGNNEVSLDGNSLDIASIFAVAR